MTAPPNSPALHRAADLQWTPDELWGLLAHLPVPVALHDLNAEGTARFVNSAFTETYGYSLEDVPTVSAWMERAYPDATYRQEVAARWWAEIEARRTTGRIAPPGEYRLIDKAGRIRYALIGFSLHGDLALVTLQDVTEVRRTEAALMAERRKTELTAFALTENMPGGAYTMVLAPGDSMAKFAFLSQRFLDMLDLRREEAEGDPSTGFSRVHPDDRPEWIRLNAEAFASRTPFSAETRVIVRGQTRWVRAESVPRALEDGSIIWEGILVDITRLKQTEQQLTAVLEASKAFVWSLDLRTRRLEFNQRWAVAHGLVPEASVTTLDDWFGSLHPDDAPHVTAAMGRLLRGEAEKQSAVYRRRHLDGHWLWVQVHAGISERDANGIPLTMSGVSFDITEEVTQRLRAQAEQAELREELQRAQQRDTVAQVARGVAHDLNNLIGVILWTLETLEGSSGLHPKASRGLGQIRRAVDMARDLIAGLGGPVRPAVPRGICDLRQLLPAAVDLLGSKRIAEHSIRLDMPDGPLPVWANSTEVLQVIVNLAINACDSGGGDRVATVGIRAHPPGTSMPQRQPDAGDRVPEGMEVTVFSIMDTGTGISPDVRARMFRRNFTTKGSEGTGLGLLIVTRVLQENHAALWVDTEPGKGTTITVAWPTAPVEGSQPAIADAQGAPRAAKRAGPDLLRGVRALVVDDLPDVAEVLTEMLERSGATVRTETDPDAVRRLLSRTPAEWSVLVTDLHMPGTDGHGLARLAATLSPPVPVVLVTARPDTLGDFSLRDFAAVLPKPVSAAQLAQAVRIAADSRRRKPRQNA